MLTLINTNAMTPPIAPVGLEYVAQAAIQAGIDVDILDLCLAKDRAKALSDYFSAHSPGLIGLSLRNADDCFWPSCRWFVPDFVDLVNADAACTSMLETYAQPYSKSDIARAVTLCRTHGLIVMTDLLLGGPGETHEPLLNAVEQGEQGAFWHVLLKTRI